MESVNGVGDGREFIVVVCFGVVFVEVVVLDLGIIFVELFLIDFIKVVRLEYEVGDDIGIWGSF